MCYFHVKQAIRRWLISKTRVNPELGYRLIKLTNQILDELSRTTDPQQFLYIWQKHRVQLQAVPFRESNEALPWNKANEFVEYLEKFIFVEDKSIWHHAFLLSFPEDYKNIRHFNRSNSCAESGNRRLKEIIGEEAPKNQVSLCIRLKEQVFTKLSEIKPNFATEKTTETDSKDAILAKDQMWKIHILTDRKENPKFVGNRCCLVHKESGALHGFRNDDVFKYRMLPEYDGGNKWFNGKTFAFVWENFYLVKFECHLTQPDAFKLFSCTCENFPKDHFCAHGHAIYLLFCKKRDREFTMNMPLKPELKKLREATRDTESVSEDKVKVAKYLEDKKTLYAMCDKLGSANDEREEIPGYINSILHKLKKTRVAGPATDEMRGNQRSVRTAAQAKKRAVKPVTASVNKTAKKSQSKDVRVFLDDYLPQYRAKRRKTAAQA
jgi:hypothetical protein